MNIKSLLLGSAAALAVVSGAHAADAIVAAEPEPAEFVKVCDAFGAGYFYIPGTETCLKIGGFARFQVGFDSSNKQDYYDDVAGEYKTVNIRKWNATMETSLAVSTKSDSDLGIIEGFMDLRAKNNDGVVVASSNGTTNNVLHIDSAYVSVGGLKAGYFAGFFDQGIGEGSSWALNSKFNAVSYTYEANGFKLGVGLDEIREAGLETVLDKSFKPKNETTPEENGTFKNRNDNGLGFEAVASYTVGGVTGTVIGVYDGDTSNGAIKGIFSAKDAGPGNLSLAFAWSTGDNIYTGLNSYDNFSGQITALAPKWAIGGAYEIAATDRLTVAPEFQVGETFKDESGKSGKAWMAGALTTYKLANNLTASVDVNYFSTTDVANIKSHKMGGYVRLQRSF